MENFSAINNTPNINSEFLTTDIVHDARRRHYSHQLVFTSNVTSNGTHLRSSSLNASSPIDPLFFFFLLYFFENPDESCSTNVFLRLLLQHSSHLKKPPVALKTEEKMSINTEKVGVQQLNSLSMATVIPFLPYLMYKDEMYFKKRFAHELINKQNNNMQVLTPISPIQTINALPGIIVGIFPSLKEKRKMRKNKKKNNKKEKLGFWQENHSTTEI